MLYEQQRSAGATLAALENNVKSARLRFTELVIKQRFWESREGVDNLFKRGSNKNISESLAKIKES